MDALLVRDADGRNPRLLTNGVRWERPAWSPDGRQIACTKMQADRGIRDMEICAMNADGSGLRRLIEHPGIDCDPCWSPDGKQIASTSAEDGNPEIYIMDADGSSPVNLTRNRANDQMPQWVRWQNPE